jgi:hypothetical protein
MQIHGETTDALRARMDRAVDAGHLQSLRDAIYHAGEGRHHRLAPKVLDLLKSATDFRVAENSAWALGKLHYKPAAPVLIALLRDERAGLVKAAAWALGEMGALASTPALHLAMVKWDDTDVAPIVGSALKKLRENATAFAIERRMGPPETDRADVQAIVERLEELDGSGDRTQIVGLRSLLQEMDPAHFSRYMAHIAERDQLIREFNGTPPRRLERVS